MYMPFSKFTHLSLLMAARWPVQSPDKSTQKPEAQKAQKWEARASLIMIPDALESTLH